MSYHSLLSALPVRPGDTVYIVWEDDTGWRLTAEKVLYVLFDEEERLLVKVTDATDEVLRFDEDQLYTSLADALERYNILNGGVVPRPDATRSVEVVISDPLRIEKATYMHTQKLEGFYNKDGVKLADEDILAW